MVMAGTPKKTSPMMSAGDIKIHGRAKATQRDMAGSRCCFVLFA
jgi:hypothetical protein